MLGDELWLHQRPQFILKPTVGFDLKSTSLPPAPVPAPGNVSAEVSDESEAEGEWAMPSRKRPRSYSSTELTDSQKEVVREKLMARTSIGDFKATVPDVFSFFIANFPSIGKLPKC